MLCARGLASLLHCTFPHLAEHWPCSTPATQFWALSNHQAFVSRQLCNMFARAKARWKLASGVSQLAGFRMFTFIQSWHGRLTSASYCFVCFAKIKASVFGKNRKGDYLNFVTKFFVLILPKRGWPRGGRVHPNDCIFQHQQGVVIGYQWLPWKPDVVQ